MNKLKVVGASMIAAGQLTTQDWLFVLSILITVLGMIQDYLQNRKPRKPKPEAT